MTRPPWEVADVIRIAGSRFRERYGASLTWPQVKVLRAIARCRTAALGGHLDACTGCGYVAGISYNSCRNRHCPKCQTGAREKWLAKRQQELLPVNYFHLVFDTASQREAESSSHPARGMLSNDPEALQLASDGIDAFMVRTAQRILDERSSEIAFNYCPRCGAFAKTPRARQRRFCRHDWHSAAATCK